MLRCPRSLRLAFLLQILHLGDIDLGATYTDCLVLEVDDGAYHGSQYDEYYLETLSQLCHIA